MAGSLTRFDPLSDMIRFDPFRNMDDFFREFAMAPSLRGMEAEPRIRMDLSETDQEYQIQAEIPGVKKEDIKIAIDGNKISISAELKQETEINEGNMIRSERRYGQQYRSITLPQDVDDSKAQAKFQDGVLNLSLPKKPGSGGKQLTIQ
ncbi:MAG TPA: Hsp20/alpha crystallin family protein [Noviherbaspirillum sp.]|nr:Hsp20/alpha crystallin family protein [Noviherbaspirillum sp.]